MRALRSFFVAGAIGATSLVGVMAAPAGAAGAPPNDNPGGAKVINGLPYSVEQNTKGATTSDAERKLTSQCGLPAVRNGVWFKFTPGANLLLKVNGEGTSYSVGFVLARGPITNMTVVGTCGGLVIGSPVTKGTTYWIFAFDYTPGSAGGTLRMQASRALAMPAVAISVNPSGVWKPRTGAARVSGTASCKGTGSRLVFIEASISQDAGTPAQARGFVFISLSVVCSDTPITWQADAFPEGIANPFAPGSARVEAFATACNIDQCGQVSTTRTIMLKLPT